MVKVLTQHRARIQNGRREKAPCEKLLKPRRFCQTCPVVTVCGAVARNSLSTLPLRAPAVWHAAVLFPAGGNAQPVLRLQAEKKVFSRQAVADISPADAAARLVCLSEEGQVCACH